MLSKPLLKVQDLKTHFYTERGLITAVDGVGFEVYPGEILGVVGESGCGKSVTAQSIMRLFDEEYTAEYEGRVYYRETDLLKLPMEKMRKIRGNDIAMIFQDPLSSLNPVYTIGYQIRESLMLHHKLSEKNANERALEMLELVGIPDPQKRIKEYPHQLSGGMRQRIMIAIALACEPNLLIADEPTTALDVTIQAQILDLIEKLNKKLNMGVIFITHDLGVVAELCTRVVVMYLGQIVEEASVAELFERPSHPYTKGLIKSVPKLEGDRTKELNVIKGTVPPINDKPKGCRFVNRCPHASEICAQQNPSLRELDSRRVRCWHAEQILMEKEGENVWVSGNEEDSIISY